MIWRTISAALPAAVVAAGLVAAGPPAAATPAAGPPAGLASTAIAAAASVSVRTGAGPLNVRSNASTWHAPVGRLADGARVTVRCQLGGERIAGRVRTTAMWLQIGDQRYVSEAYLAWRAPRAKLPWCDQPAYAAPRTRTAFISWAATHARASRSRYKVPVSVAVAQAINESGWGRSSLTTQGNAYFGIKCFGTPGPVAAGCRPYHTSECDNDDCFATTGTFRVYRSAARSFLDHGRFLRVNPRYQPAFRHTASPDRFAREIHKAGYATDPRYSDKLIALMREYDLYRFDR
jgi:flagellar protein FlgJ